MSGGAPPRPAAPALGVPGGGAPRRRPASPELLRCSRRRRPGAQGPGAGGGAAAVARRNERERNRVKLVNLGFQALRQHVPRGAGRRLSKVETLRSAAAYIGALQRLLAEPGPVRAALAGGLLPAPRPPAPPAASPSGASSSPGRGGSSEPGSPRSAYSSDGGGEGARSPAERELLGFSGWLGGC